jgi:hypothetical protein
MSEELAMVFRDKYDTDVVRVEWFDSDGGCEVSLFTGPRAAERAVSFAKTYYVRFHLDELNIK